MSNVVGNVASEALSRPAATATAITSGLTLWTAFPNLNWWPAAPAAIAGLALACRGQRPRHALWIGLLGGLAFMIPHLHWSGIYVGLLPWTALATLESLYLAAMCALFPLAWRAPGGPAGTVTALTGLWVAQEALRGGTPFGGFPWARIAFSQADAPTLGYAALGGAPLLSASVALAGACLAVAATELLTTPTPHRTTASTTRRALLALAAATTVLLGGLAVPHAPGPDETTNSTRTAQIAAIQGNVPTPGLDFNAERRAVLDNHTTTTRRLAADVAAGRAPQPDVVLWPENASDIDPLRNADAHAEISRAANAIKAPVLVGAILDEPAPRFSNASLLWEPAGSTAPGPGQRYIKRHPAPFGEYIPYRSFFRIFSDKVDLVPTDFAPGRTVGTLRAGPVTLGPVICFEVAYDDLVRDTVRSGADLLVIQTNNATFGYTDESVQQLAMSRVRAVESGRAVVHISTVGVSALIGPDGRELARSDHFTQQVLQARLPLRTARTTATRVGAAPEEALAGVGLLLTGAGGHRGRTRRRAASRSTSRGHGKGPGPGHPGPGPSWPRIVAGRVVRRSDAG